MFFSCWFSKSKFFHVITSPGLRNYHCNCTKCSGGCIGCFAVWRTELPPPPLPLPARGRSEVCFWTNWRTTLTGHRLYEGSFESSSSQNSEFRLNGKISPLIPVACSVFAIELPIKACTDCSITQPATKILCLGL